MKRVKGSFDSYASAIARSISGAAKHVGEEELFLYLTQRRWELGDDFDADAIVRDEVNPALEWRHMAYEPVNSFSEVPYALVFWGFRPFPRCPSPRPDLSELSKLPFSSCERHIANSIGFAAVSAGKRQLARYLAKCSKQLGDDFDLAAIIRQEVNPVMMQLGMYYVRLDEDGSPSELPYILRFLPYTTEAEMVFRYLHAKQATYQQDGGVL